MGRKRPPQPNRAKRLLAVESLQQKVGEGACVSVDGWVVWQNRISMSMRSRGYEALPSQFQRMMRMMKKDFNLELRGAEQKSRWTLGGILDSFKLRFHPTDATTVSQRRVVSQYPGNAFLNSYLMTIFATKQMSEALMKRLVRVLIFNLLCCQVDRFCGPSDWHLVDAFGASQSMFRCWRRNFY